ncbi:hypothetical protein ACLMJK_002412 [Lecanora helva]
MVLRTTLWLCCISSTLAVIHEQLAAVPNGWAKVGAPADTDTITLQIGLTQQNMDKLDSMIYEVSTPGSTSYGKYMEGHEVAAMVQPSSEANNAVLSWLKEAGVENVHSDSTDITFSTNVGTANRLLNTTFNYYTNEGVQKLRTMGYSIPDELAKQIDLVTPTTYFGKTTAQVPTPKMHYPSRNLAPRQANSSCANLITPICIKELYNINYIPDPKSGSRIGFGSFLNQSARFQDLSLFEKAFSIPQQGFSVQLINGGVNDQSISRNHGEANLDVEYLIGTSHPLPVISYVTGGSPPFVPNLDEPTAADNQNEPYLNYYQYLLSQRNSALPNIISNSYGDDEQTVPEKYAKRVCSLIGQLGLRGISVLESSGDTGIGAPCQSNDGLKTPQFTPQFPGTCPYITAVGGTQSINPEVAWNDSSGGFSNYFPRPQYQANAVETYLENYISKDTLTYFSPFFNSSNRGFPDVAAHSLTPEYVSFSFPLYLISNSPHFPPPDSTNPLISILNLLRSSYSVIVNNNLTLSGGTSAAAPVFSSIIALLNDARFRAGKPPLGFLNPWLYEIGVAGLTDITAGGSVGCNGVNGQTRKPIPGGSVIPGAGWNATVGWDPVTGLGVPDFGRLVHLAVAS